MSGIDTITSTISRTLAPFGFIENLYLQGTAAINGTGNGIANVVVGNVAGNILRGGGGVDVLRGAVGADSYFGEAGNDQFRFLAANESAVGAGRDVIQDLDDNGDDVIDLRFMPGVTTFINTNAFSAPGQVRIQQLGAHVLVQINLTGNSVAESEILIANATIGAGPGQVSGSDFWL